MIANRFRRSRSIPARRFSKTGELETGAHHKTRATPSGFSFVTGSLFKGFRRFGRLISGRCFHCTPASRLKMNFSIPACSSSKSISRILYRCTNSSTGLAPTSCAVSGRLSKGHFVIPGPLRSAGLALKVCEKITGYSKLSNASASNSRRVSRGTVKQSLTAVNENVKSVELKMCVWASVL